MFVTIAAPGETVVILGANGAGKTTLVGQIMLNGTEITQLPPHRIVELGVALVPEGRRIFGELTNRTRAGASGSATGVMC